MVWVNGEQEAGRPSVKDSKSNGPKRRKAGLKEELPAEGLQLQLRVSSLHSYSAVLNIYKPQ